MNDLQSSRALGSSLGPDLSSRNRSRFVRVASATGLGLVLGLPACLQAQHYLQTNLVSDVPGLAAATDPDLVNAWGLSRSATSPWWVADNGTGLSTLYNGAGAKQGLIVTIPPATGGDTPSAPTGTVFNASSDFKFGPNNTPARFLFATEDGSISAWAGGAAATRVIDLPGQAVYKGLTLAQSNGVNRLYAANFMTNAVDVFDAAFQPVNLGSNAFRDHKLPKHYSPFNVQTIGNLVFVTFAKHEDGELDETAGAGLGFVDAFTPEGVLQMRLQSGPWMNAPWGVAWAPADFGKFSDTILVGQFGSGKIAAFNPKNGHFRGLVRGEHGRPIRIEGLWALSFGGGDASASGPANSLYFSAGIDDEAHGLFGTITALPKDHHKGKDCDRDGDDDDDDNRD